MPAPLAAAAMYFGLPRLLGGLAEKAASSRAESLFSQGADPSQDTLVNLLSLVPKQSGLESTLDALGTLNFYRNMPLREPLPFEETPTGAQVTRELPYGGAEFLDPMEDFLKYGGRDDDSGLSPYARLMEDIDRNRSYGYTSQPAPEIRFDDDLFDLDDEPKMQSVVVEAPRVQQGGGFANGGLAALIGNRYAKHKR